MRKNHSKIVCIKLVHLPYFLLGYCFKNKCTCGVMQRSRRPTFMHQIRTTKAFPCFGWDMFKQVLLFTELVSERKC